MEEKKDKKIIGVQVSNDMAEQIKKIADEKFISMSDVIRAIIFKYLETLKEGK